MRDIVAESIGRWQGILLATGLDEPTLSGRHCSCPACGGKDRFRFDDNQGWGTFYCTNCGAGNGFKLLENVYGWSFTEAVIKIGNIMNGTTIEKSPPKPEVDYDLRRSNLNKLHLGSKMLDLTDPDCSPVVDYLRSRNIKDEVISASQGLRCHMNMEYYEPREYGDYSDPKVFAAMLASIKNHGKASTLHATYLTYCGDKAIVPSPRKIMPRTEVEMKGGAVQLFEYDPEVGVLGVAEGIETAMTAYQQFHIPTWACVNADNLMAFNFPEGLKELHIFGDNDASYTGQAVAYTLARIAKRKGIETVIVCIPDGVGQDWNDVIR